MAGTVQERLQSLIAAANQTTGGSDADMTTATQALIAGYGVKPEQEKTVTITQNGTTEILPDEGKVLSKVTTVVDVPNPLKYAASLNAAYAGAKFPEGCEISIEAPNATVLTAAFDNASGAKICRFFSMGDSTIEDASRMFLSSSIETIYWDCNRPIKAMSNMFQSSRLEKIIGEIDFTGCSNAGYTFGVASELTAVQFKPDSLGVSSSIQWSHDLDKPSIISCISGLNPDVSGQTFRLSKRAIDKALETSPGKNNGSASPEWKALVDSKPSWTIAI